MRHRHTSLQPTSIQATYVVGICLFLMHMLAVVSPATMPLCSEVIESGRAATGCHCRTREMPCAVDEFEMHGETERLQARGRVFRLQGSLGPCPYPCRRMPRVFHAACGLGTLPQARISRVVCCGRKEAGGVVHRLRGGAADSFFDGYDALGVKDMNEFGNNGHIYQVVTVCV